MKFYIQLRNFILDTLFPIKCLSCNVEFENLEPAQRWICPQCLEKIKIRRQQVCPVCEQFSDGGRTHHKCAEKTHLDGLWVATEYKYDIISSAIRKFKFNFVRDISFPLSSVMIRSILEVEEYGDFQDIILTELSQNSNEEKIYIDEEKNIKTETVLIPVPLHKKRYNWRGFNQSFLLSEYISDKFDLKITSGVLIRNKNTKPQSKLKSVSKREKNIKGAFACLDENKIKGKSMVIIDDVCTSLLTLDECAKILKKAKAKNVWGLVVARR